ncbi:hypothetical protein [Lysinibacillus endophyticus]|uniref:hypothetical protein n=1 Tax=Ureibacillus endophyticus TaxID=1978490 RepID=UPI00209DA7D1|nr:hypothetical protein [Lysinibacillus endophyticus]MCP1143663.1 hypothetical protein [Lysinibacillus endophyticus]
MAYNLTDVGREAFPHKTPEYQHRKTSNIIRELLAIPWIDETQYKAVGAKEYSFSKPAFDIWVFLVKHYKDFKDYNEEFSTKKEKQKINQFVLDIIAFKEQMDQYLTKKIENNENQDDISKEEKLIYQEYQQLSDADFENVYMLFNNIYYASLQHGDRIVAKLKMNYMEQVNKEIDRVLKQIYDVSEPDNITKRAELYIEAMLNNIKKDSETYLKLIE